MHYDWIKLVTRLVTSNQSALFQCRVVAMALLNLSITSAPSSELGFQQRESLRLTNAMIEELLLLKRLFNIVLCWQPRMVYGLILDNELFHIKKSVSELKFKEIVETSHLKSDKVRNITLWNFVVLEPLQKLAMCGELLNGLPKDTLQTRFRYSVKTNGTDRR